MMNHLKIAIVLFAMGCLIFSCQEKESSYTISGTIEKPEGFEVPEGFNMDSVILSDFSRKVIAKVPIKDNQFTIEGSMPEPLKTTIAIGPFRSVVFLENTSYEVSIEEEGLLVNTNGEMHTLIYGYTKDKSYQEAVKKAEEVAEKEFGSIDVYSTDEKDVQRVVEARAKVSTVQSMVREIEADYQKSIIEGDHPALAKLYALQPTTYGIRNFIKYKEVVANLKEELGRPDHPYVGALEASITRRQANIDKASGHSKGKQFKDVSTTTIDGKKLTLSEVVKENKYTLIEYWASWCGPCRIAFPHLKKTYSKYKDQGFEIYGVSLDRSEKSYLKACEEEQIPWINTVDLTAFKSDAAKAYNVSGIPFTVLIDQNGTIIDAGNDLRGVKLDDTLKELFGE